MSSIFSNEQAMTRKQYEIAHRLADRFGHAWSRYFGPEDWAKDLTPEVIREAVNEQLKDGDLAYYRSPEMDEDGNIHHVTGTGRVEWYVDPDGTVDVFVHRPMRDSVLSFVILLDGQVTEIEDYCSHIPEETCLPRHVWAGNEVVQARLDGDMRRLHHSLEPVMERALLDAREAARKAADQLRKECLSLVPDDGLGNESWQIRRIRQVRDRLNKTVDPAAIEACAQILGV